LGPLLFLIFINDIVHVIRHCEIRLFADDTCLFIEINDTLLAAEYLNEDLEHINKWSKKWLVTFSPPKTEQMIISTKRSRIHPNIYLNSQPIKMVKEHKHLGVILSSDLKWNKHVESIAATLTDI